MLQSFAQVVKKENTTWKALRKILILTIMLAGHVGQAGAATLSAGVNHTCAIGESTGEMRCWGRGDSGQIGDGLLYHRAAPVAAFTNVSRWRSVASGNYHSCAITDAGAVWCWGWNDNGQLGDSTFVQRAQPVPVIGLTSGAVELALGALHSCARMVTGKVNCWGAGADGRLGSGQVANQTTPSEVLALDDAVSIDAGQGHTCAALADGNMKCWGLNGNGQLGDGTGASRTVPVFVSTTMPVAKVALAALHTCALGTTGAVQCWGRNNVGQVGDGTVVQRLIPVGVDGLSGGVTLLTAGSHHTCALAAGALKCWGYNSYGQLGNGTFVDSTRPVAVVGVNDAIREITGGGEYSCARSASNMIRCWGRDEYGSTGVGDIDTPRYHQQPLLINGLPNPLRKLSLRTNTTCAITTAGSAACWGQNDYSQMGNGSVMNQAGARDVVGPLSGIRDIAMGEHHACSIRANGTVWCWGRNQFGQIADATTITRPIPVQAVGIVDAVEVKSAHGHACARTAAGAVWCWGRNNWGQLGDGTTVERHQPVRPVGLDTGVVAITLGDQHGCALKNTGNVQCWGRNNRGEIGDSTLVDRNVPTPIDDAFATYVAVAAGGEHTCALTTAGQAKCWGYNVFGQLGDSTTGQRATPAGVDGLTTGVVQIATGDHHSCALLATGAMKCWGYNNRYQLGDGTLTNRLQAVTVINLVGEVQSMALGAQSSCVVLTNGIGKCWGNNVSGQLGNGTVGLNWSRPENVSQWLREDVNFSDLIFRNGFEP